MSKLYYIIAGIAAVGFSAFIATDIYAVHRDISINEKTINSLNDFNANNEKNIKDLELKIQRIKNNPKAAETLLIQKYKMLRKDQFIVQNGKNN